MQFITIGGITLNFAWNRSYEASDGYSLTDLNSLMLRNS